MPANVEEEVNRIIKIVEAKMASPKWGRDQLAKYGYTFAADEDTLIANAVKNVAAASDPFGARVEEEITTQEGTL